jgi:hypothetical protein
MTARVFTLLAAVSLAAAEMRLTVDNLMQFIESSVEMKHADAQVADYLRHVKLTNRLDEQTVEKLQRFGAGPRTVAVLKELRDSSAQLPAPPPVTRIAATAPRPDAAEQKKIIQEVRDNALNYSRQLPNFICAEVTRRFYDPTGQEDWHLSDTITANLSYFDQKEDYKVVLVNNLPVSNLPMEKMKGTVSVGEFGSLLRGIFEPETETRFEWDRWFTLHDQTDYVFAYDVDQLHSRYQVIADRSLGIVTAYRGLVYVDRDTKMVSRVTLDAYNIPVTFPIQSVRTVLAYDLHKIGANEYMLPSKSTITSRSGKLLTRNEKEFRLYRKYGAETNIKFDATDR